MHELNNFLFAHKIIDAISNFPTVHHIKEIIYMFFESSMNHRKNVGVRLNTLCEQFCKLSHDHLKVNLVLKLKQALVLITETSSYIRQCQSFP